MRRLALLELPHCGVNKLVNYFHNHYQNNLANDASRCKVYCQKPSHFFAPSPPEVLREKGLFLTDPSVRLARAYLKSTAKDQLTATFQEFYSQPHLINFYTKTLKGIDLATFTFLGVDSLFNLSLVSLAQHCNVDSSIHMPFTKFESVKVSKLLADCDLIHLKALHAEDFSLYEKVKATVRKKLQALAVDYSATIPASKKMLIHVGPPKTGTSAIQAFLLDRQCELMEQGIFYPSHGVDDNKVSSGNYLAVLSHDANNDEVTVDTGKCNTLVEQFIASDYNTLLLSSEVFSNHLATLMTHFNSAEFIYYMRHPAAQIESRYHQEVKRHGKTTVFTLPDKISFRPMLAFFRLAQEFDVKISLRFYDPEINENRKLIDDFCSLLNFNVANPAPSTSVNTRYGIEELEFMRACNQFADKLTLLQIDPILQHSSTPKARFTLLSIAQQEEINRQYEQTLKRVLNHYTWLDSEPEVKQKLAGLTAVKVDYPLVAQGNSAQIIPVWEHLKRNHFALALEIREQLVNCSDSHTLIAKFSWNAVDRIKAIRYKLARKRRALFAARQ